MNKKDLIIGLLSLSAVTLLLINYFAPQQASAMLTIKDRDFSLVTARGQTNGDALFILDNRSGKVAVFGYDPSSRALKARFVGELSAVFPNNP